MVISLYLMIAACMLYGLTSTYDIGHYRNLFSIAAAVFYFIAETRYRNRVDEFNTKILELKEEISELRSIIHMRDSGKVVTFITNCDDTL